MPPREQNMPDSRITDAERRILTIIGSDPAGMCSSGEIHGHRLCKGVAALDINLSIRTLRAAKLIASSGGYFRLTDEGWTWLAENRGSLPTRTAP